jgi:hypothetical protein
MIFVRSFYTTFRDVTVRSFFTVMMRMPYRVMPELAAVVVVATARQNITHNESVGRSDEIKLSQVSSFLFWRKQQREVKCACTCTCTAMQGNAMHSNASTFGIRICYHQFCSLPGTAVYCVRNRSRWSVRHRKIMRRIQLYWICYHQSDRTDIQKHYPITRTATTRRDGSASDQRMFGCDMCTRAHELGQGHVRAFDENN